MVESSTLFGAKPSAVTVIGISDDELDISHNVSPDRQGSGNISLAKYFAGQKGKDLDHNPTQNNEILDICEDVLFDAKTKRKRRCKVVMIKSESVHDDDDDISNSRRRKKREADDSITEAGHKKEERRAKRVSIMPKYLEDYMTTNSVKRS
ncbi:unnamed protein product [Vicia faba]|uniref:Uncharacterized protein n=1 Tax=Vicia faba TaxID=3906 RepID=A0AAV1A5T2_VICFA|nr:unnamed protein product [Vicia faba]